MPKHKDPPSLRKMSFNRSFILITEICKNIFITSNSHNDLRCIEQIEEINQFLCANLCPEILEEMLHNRTACTEIKDARILIATFVSIHTRHFKVDASKELYISKTFWISLIQSLKNLVSLDLTLVCTDPILSIVGKYCPKLEFINATSSYKRMQSDFNALLLSRTVTDKGLNCLLNCRQLRKIVIDEPRGKFKNGVTCKGIEKLLKNLKNLEEISFSDLGPMIGNGFLKDNTLKLIKVTQFKVSTNKIKSIEHFCPCLKSLQLTNFGPDEVETYESLSYLSESTIFLENIKLSYFSYNRNIAKYFQLKGEFLTCVTFIGESDRSFGTKAIQHIGTFCPNIVMLHVERLSKYDNQIDFTYNLGKVFVYLKKLIISGSSWDVEKIIPLCLSQVSHIHHISLTITDGSFRNSSAYCIEQCLMKVIEKNPTILKSLAKIQFCNPVKTSSDFIEFMLKYCDLLSSVKVWCDDVEKCVEIKKRLILENYDVDFEYDLEL